MIDWITARLPMERFSRSDRIRLSLLGDRIQRYNPQTGVIEWETAAWDSIRSDSHGVVYRIGGDALWIQGSPARVVGDGCNVFGSGPASAMDLAGCLRRMRAVVFDQLPVDDPSHDRDWIVSRVDVTYNLDLGSLEQVRAALRVLRDLEGGRYRVSQQAGDTVYWSHRSRLRAGKAYAKGPHLRHLMRLRQYQGREYSESDIRAVDRLLRLELRLGSQFWRERAGNWWEWTPERLRAQWDEYFGRMIGSAEVVSDVDVRERVMAVARTEGQGRAAYGCWLMIQREGWERAREAYSRSSWYRHLGTLRAAGLSDADFSAGRIVEFRRRIIEARVVETWAELRAA